MSIEVAPRMNPAEELNLLLRLIPLNHPAKTEVSSYLTQISNIQNGKMPDGTSFLPGGNIPSMDELISQVTMGTLVDKGFSILIKNPTDKQKAVKNFILSAIKDGENVDVGSMVAAFLPKEAMSLISKVFQADIIGKNIFQLKDIALKRLDDLRNQAQSIMKQAQSFATTISSIAATFGELPEVANALTQITAIANAITDVAEFIDEKIADVEKVLEEIEKLADGVPTTTEPPVTPPTSDELPPVPDSVTGGELPTPNYPEPEEEEGEAGEEATDIIFE